MPLPSRFTIAFIFASVAFAADTRVVDMPAFTATPKDLLAEAANGPANGGENSVVLLDDDRWVFNKNGDMVRSMHVIAHVLTAQGVEQWSNLEWRWEPWHEKRPNIKVRVITPDGAVHTLDQSTVVDGPAGGQDRNMYSDARAVKCPLPGMTPGAVLEEEVEISSEHLLTGTVLQAYFGRGVPVRLARATLEYPEELGLKYTAFLLPDLKTTKTSEGGVARVVLEMGPLAPNQSVEPLLPPDVPRYPHIVFSTAHSWKELAENYNKIVEERIAGSDVSSIVNDAKASAKNRAQLIERLVRQLHAQIRYTGVEFGDAAIIPAKPNDTLQRKYGDCKDKSALLVTMLRSAGIPAHLALLETGPGEDVNVQHPGMGRFDHAIVYVPGSPDLWIDATAEYLASGFLPAMDQGRQALIIRPGTDGLSMIPESASSARVNVETREFYLPDYGKSRVVEINSGTGNADAGLRAEYGSADTEQLRNNLAKYMRAEYIADSTLKIDHPKGNDFSKPFELRLEMDQADRASVTQLDGAVGMPLGALFENLPSYFKTEDKKPTADEANKPAKKRTADFVLNEAFISERHYHIHLPPGFQVLNLPEGQTLQMGPAKFTSAFQQNKDEITADFRFDCGKRRYTAEEGLELKKQLVDFLKKPVLVLQLRPLGQMYLTEGKIREALEQYEAMAKQYPNKVVYRVQLSEALLTAGCGTKAREEARRAVEIDGKSALAYQNLGFVLLNDLIGRSFGKGFDPVGAEAALRKAIELDSKEQLNRRNLGVLLEHTPDGRRYTSVPRLNEAIKVYREMGDELLSSSFENNLLYDLTYAGRFQELRTELDKLQVVPLTLAFKLVATTKLESLAAAMTQAEKEATDENARSSALQTAGEILLALREYPAASEMLAAGAKGAQNPTQLVSRANALRMVKQIDGTNLKADTPENLVRAYFAAIVLGSEDEKGYDQMQAPEAMAGQTAEDRRKEREMAMRGMNVAVEESGLTNQNFLDFLLSVAQIKVDKNGEDGCRVQILFPGRSQAQSLFVSKDGAVYRLLGGADSSGLGRRILGDVKKGDLTAARRWLDWAREELKIAGGDDPLDGPVFPRVWSKGMQGDEAAIRNAAAVLVGNAKNGKDALPLLKEALSTTKAEPAKTYAQLAYIQGCLVAWQLEDALPVVKAAAEAHPESPNVANMLMSVYIGLHRWKEADAVANARLARDPDELQAARVLAEAKAGEGNFRESEAMSRKMADSPKGTPGDWNQVGWFSLFAGDLTADKIAGMQQAMTTNSSAGLLHTLAAMYAEAGKSTEARETILAAMRQWGLDEPDGLCWLVFGRLAEQFGVTEEATADYGKVKGTEEDNANGGSPFSTYALAQKRLAGLKK